MEQGKIQLADGTVSVVPPQADRLSVAEKQRTRGGGQETEDRGQTTEDRRGQQAVRLSVISYLLYGKRSAVSGKQCCHARKARQAGKARKDTKPGDAATLVFPVSCELSRRFLRFLRILRISSFSNSLINYLLATGFLDCELGILKGIEHGAQSMGLKFRNSKLKIRNLKSTI